MTSWIFQTIQYLKFLLRSTNKHGVHSPFVFDLVTNCFNQKDKLQYSKQSKSDRLSKKIMSYFKNNTCIVVKDDLHEVQSIERQINKLENDCYIIILNPYSFKKKILLWNQLIQLKTVSVSIDTFYIGLLFVRKEQPKQHFVIRT